jgi:hypothetical protein
VDIRHFAKLLVETRNPCGLTRQDFEEEIAKRAGRREGESTAQAFTRYATTTEDGKLLFKAAVMAPAPKQAPQDFPTKKPEPKGGAATAELNELARAMAREKNFSFEQAFSRLWSDPTRADLVNRVKREQVEATRDVRDQRWPIAAAEREFERDWRSRQTAG